MKVTYTSVRDPRWATPDRSVIICFVKFDHMKHEVEFAANCKDVMPYGREIFQDCVAGKYGSVGEFEFNVQRSPKQPAIEPEMSILDQWPELFDFLDEANKENSAGTIRGQILFWSSMIELLIGRLLNSFLVNDNISKNLLESSQFPFSVKIDLSFSLGLISKSECSVCHKIRDVRNRSAHSWSITLDDRRIRSALRSLYDREHSDTFEWIEDLDFLTKFIYSGSCINLSMLLAERQSVAVDQKRVEFAAS